MFSKSKVTGLYKGAVQTAYDGGGNKPSSYYSPGKDRTASAVQASIGFGNGAPGIAGAANMNVAGYFNSQYQYMMTGLIPADPSYTDTSALALFYRDMYLFDNVAGSAVDIQSSFGFSGYTLKGLPEKELQIFQDALDQLNIKEMLTTISTSYLVDGFSCSGLIFDQVRKQFQDTILYDALQCTVLPAPFFNTQPQIDVRVGPATSQFLNSDSPYIKNRIKALPQPFVQMLKKGAFTLNPASTLYVARRSLTDRAYVSFLHRILPMYLIEKTMFRGTLVEASRRQRAMTHITAGTDTWVPTSEELMAYVQQFMAAEYDPMGGWVVTRDGVQSQDLRPGGDFWKWTDMADILVPYKLRALGISESFLSGDATYASAESAYSTFLETQNAYREHMTNAVFYTTLFPLIAVAHGLYKDPSKAIKGGDVAGYLDNVANRNNLRIPMIQWHKSLEPKSEDDKFDMLEKASEKGVPVPLKSWMAAADIDSETLMKDLREDGELRKQLAKYTGKDTSHEGEDQLGYDDDERELSEARSMSDAAAMLSNPILPMKSGLVRNRRALLSRDFGSGEVVGQTKTGKPKYLHNQSMYRKEMNRSIARISVEMNRDENYRRKVANNNKATLGHTTIPGAMDIKAR